MFTMMTKQLILNTHAIQAIWKYKESGHKQTINIIYMMMSRFLI